MSEETTVEGSSRPTMLDRTALASVLVCTVVLFGLTLCPTVYWYDSAEFSAHAVTLGVPHPPGYPLYTMLAHLFTWLPGEAALGVNRMSLVFGVGAVSIVYALVRRLGGSVAAAVIAAATLATARTFWANAVVAEVYTPGLVMTLGALLLLVRAHQDRWRRGVILAGLIGGLGVGMHMSITTFGIGYAWMVWTFDLPEKLRPRMLVERLRSRLWLAILSALAAASGLLVFVYVPLRKFEKWDGRDWTIFAKNSTGGAFKRKFLKDYDFGKRLDLLWDIWVDNLLVVGVVLAVVGLAVLVARKPKTGVGVVLAAAGNLWWFFNYRVPDLDVFFLPAIALGCVGVGLAADTVSEPLRRFRARLHNARWLLLALPLSLIPKNYESVDLSEATGASVYGNDACDVVQGDAQVINYSSPTEWRYYSVFIYMQATAQRCATAKVWRKPRTAAVDRVLRAGGTVYTFRPVRALKARFKVTEAGPLWRVQLRGKGASSRRPTRSAPVHP
ncbi:MAG: DUF2723 domain-containing protein [Nannocystaceae bacterium]|nr:DUF2723 domain-containing protein [Nannocystaceae bacterium]